jgi:hypothetical protein
MTRIPSANEPTSTGIGEEYQGSTRPDIPAVRAYGAQDPSSRSNQATVKANIAITGLFLAGIGCLYLLRLSNGPASASAESVAAEQQVDCALARMKVRDEGPITSTQDILKTLDYDVAERQVPVDKLDGNPFVFDVVWPQSATDGSDPASTPGASSAQTPEQTAETAAASEFSALQLQSILTGASEAIAVISGKVVREGDTIHGWRVEQISERSVSLTWKDVTRQLTLPAKTSSVESR